MSLLLTGTLVLPDRLLEGGAVFCEDGRIAWVGRAADAPRAGAAIAGAYVCPGFVDLHVHGGGGADFMDGSVEAARTVAKTHLAHGTTAMLATTLTAPPAAIARAVRAARLAGPPVVGMHIEGPYLNPQQKGAQDPAHMKPPVAVEAEEWLSLWEGAPFQVSFAPELSGALDFARRLGGRARLAAAHTDATYDQMQAAFAAGISHAVHLFNAMRGLHHREPGVVGAVLASDSVTAELILDGLHVHPAAARLAFRALGDRLCLITDAMMAAGKGDGRYRLAALEVEVRDGAARLAGTETLAGSVLTMDRAVANAVRLAGLGLVQAVAAASTHPARWLGLNKGRLAPGLDADIALLDENLSCLATVLGGRLAYRR